MIARSRNPIGVAAAKTQFFDRQVFAAYERAEKLALSKFGAYVRSDARKSMRRAPKRKRIVGRNFGARDERGRFLKATGGREVVQYGHSSAGNPPYTIKGQLRRFIYFLYDRFKQNVIIGPIKLARKSGSGVPVPGLHEHSGHQMVRFGRKQVVAHYPARPYMRPAGEKNVKKLGQLWRDSIK